MTKTQAVVFLAVMALVVAPAVCVLFVWPTGKAWDRRHR